MVALGRLASVLKRLEKWGEAAACLEAVSDAELTGNDVAVLNTIRMKERAKSRTEIARLLNREDVSNIQYALRKLLREGLIEKSDAASRKTATYRATKAGVGVTEAYAEMRRAVLIEMSPHLTDGDSPFEEAGAPLSAKRVLFLGTGGAVRAVAFAMAEQANPAKITLLGRTAANVESLVSDLREGADMPIEGGDLASPQAALWLWVNLGSSVPLA